MLTTDVPTKLAIPFADAAGVSYIRAIPEASQIGIEDGAASLEDGFPPLNATPIVSGGVPPTIKDMNGILNLVSAWSRWTAAGGPTFYDGTFSTAIGGYPKGSVLTSASTAGVLYVSTIDNNTNDPDSVSTGWQKVRDALTLNGQAASYYTNIPARLGYTPLNAATYTAADILAKLLTVDGAASGLDADTVDGYHAGQLVKTSEFTANAVRTLLLTVDGAGSGIDSDRLDGQHGSYYLAAAVYTAADILAKLKTVDGAGSLLDADRVDGWDRDQIRDWNNLLNKPWIWSGQSGQPQWVWGGNANGQYFVWNPSNFNVAHATTATTATNAGNADTVDGRHASEFERVISSSSSSNGGYRIYADGYKRCWGIATVFGNTSTVINYPITFNSWSNASFSAARAVQNAQDNDPEFYQWGGSSGTVWNAADSSLTGRWRAEGY